MADLMTDDHVEFAAAFAAGIEEVRVDHHEVSADELRGKGVQHTACLHDICGRGRGQPELSRRLGHPLVDVGKLVLRHPDCVALDVGDPERVGREQEQPDKDPVHQPDDRDDDQQPGDRRKNESYCEIPFL